MFHVVEFNKNSGGGLGIVKDEWLTPRKKECFWPPVKHSDKFNKCLTTNQHITDEWKLYPIERIFCNTGDLLKAREKLKAAESESDITEDEAYPLKRKIKRTKRFNSCSDDDSSEDENDTASKELKIPKLTENTNPTIEQNSLSPVLREASHEINSPISGSSQIESTPVSSNQNTPVSRLFSRASFQETEALNNVARVLAKIDRRLLDLERSQKEILEKLSSNTTISSIAELPPQIKLPCDTIEDVNRLEEWISCEENVKILMVNLSILGGKKLPNTVRRILEKVFTNKVAECCNWTGKHEKFALKDLKITKIIAGTVRRNRNTSLATDDEIQAIVCNWFRFCKDRDGGRALRAKINKIA